MGLKYDDLIEIDRQFEGKKESSPYGRLNLMDLTDDHVVEIEMENYSEEAKKIYQELVEHFSKKEAKCPNHIIAIVGVTGVGKTTLVRHLTSQLFKYKDESFVGRNANFVFHLGGKMQFFQRSKIGKGLRGVLVMDDAHFIYYPSDEKNEKKTERDPFLDAIADIDSSVIITTWNVFGFQNALSKNPELINLFDKVLWLEGLDKKDLSSLIRRRSSAYAINKEKFNFEQVFDSEGIVSLIKESNSNPRLLIELIDQTVLEAHKRKVKFLDKALMQSIVLQNKPPKIDFDSFIKDTVLFNFLSVPRVSLKMLETFTGLERTTILKRIQKVTNGLIKEIPTKRKEKYYHLNCFLKTEVERELFENIKNQANKFVDFDKKLIE